MGVANLTPAELDAIEARLADAKSLSNRLYPLAYSDVEDLLRALRAAWEEIERVRANLVTAERVVEDLEAAQRAAWEERDRARETNKRLNRRCQEAEAALPEWRKVREEVGAKQATGRFWPALMANALARATDENDRLRALVEQAFREGMRQGRLYNRPDADDYDLEWEQSDALRALTPPGTTGEGENNA